MLEAYIKKKLPHFVLELSLACHSSELLAIVGSSGSGKTTLVRTLAGLEQPDAGQITINDVCWLDTQQRINVPARKRGIGYVFQEYTLLPHLTVEGNVLFAASSRTKGVELMDLLGISHLASARPHQISGGERQRTALAQALARDPRLLLLDEPFSSLDYLIRKKLQRELVSLKKQLNIPIILVTHDIEEAYLLGDDVLAMNHGKLDGQWLEKVKKECDFFQNISSISGCSNIVPFPSSKTKSLHG